MLAIMVGRQREISKLHWLKCVEQSQKTKFGQENKRFKTSLLEFIY